MSNLAQIEQKLAELLALSAPTNLSYALYSPLTQSEIEAAEQQLGVRLPEPYREIVTRLGNGGVRAFFPLRQDAEGRWSWDANDESEPAKWLQKNLRLSFVHKRATSVYDHPFFASPSWVERQEKAVTEGPEAEDALADWFEEHRDENIDSAWLDRHFQGSVAIVHYGCAIRDRLIVSGAMAGTVWHAPEGLDFKLAPIVSRETGGVVRFDEWFLRRLERQIAGYPKS